MELRIRPGALVDFWDRVTVTDGCWRMDGRLDREGYGVVYGFGGTFHHPSLAHRVAFALYAGRMPCGHVLHTCDVRNCVKEEHLYEGTQRQNLRDMVRRGRMSPWQGGAKLTPEQVSLLQARRAAGAGILQLAREFGVSTNTVYKRIGRPGY